MPSEEGNLGDSMTLALDSAWFSQQSASQQAPRKVLAGEATGCPLEGKVWIRGD